MKAVVVLLGVVVNAVCLGNILVYLIWAPRIDWAVSLIIVLSISFFNGRLYLYLKDYPSQYKVYRRISIIAIAMHLVIAVFVTQFVHSRQITDWYKARVILSILEDSLDDYYERNERFPEDLMSLNFKRMPFDPYNKNEEINYVLLNNRSCMIYSIGPDGKDGKGEVVLTEDALKYAVYVHPWSVMYFGGFLYDFTDYKSHLTGDIVKSIER